MSTDEKTYEGQCFCGAVKIVVNGDPAGVGYDHCVPCRNWSASPVNAFTLWPPEAVQVIEGVDQIGEYNMNDRTYRQWCKVCGGHLMARHPQWGLVDVYAATIPSFPFTAELHVNYESTVLPMKDGLPKIKDFPPSWAAPGRRYLTSTSCRRRRFDRAATVSAGLLRLRDRRSRPVITELPLAARRWMSFYLHMLFLEL